MSAPGTLAVVRRLRNTRRLIPKLSAIILVLWATARGASSGPPFATDDPEPVGYRHWEVYVASQLERESGDWSGTLPHLEVNYGALPNLQLHLISPLAFTAPAGESRQWGYGDTELGVKYRFVQETERWPQIGTFPLLEAPTGDEPRGLGSGETRVFLPLWIQKSCGPWTTYGGGGYWINPGAGNQDWWFAGWLLQRQIIANLTLGLELFHETAKQTAGEADTQLTLGAILDLNNAAHLLFSAGPALQGPSGFHAYGALQLTFGPARRRACFFKPVEDPAPADPSGVSA